MNTTKGVILATLGLILIGTYIFIPLGLMLFEKGLDN